jgi:ATP/maltotriose-dependent transcriptional regulator MalT
VATFTGSHRHVLDYLAEEVLDRQPEPLVRFLLEAAPDQVLELHPAAAAWHEDHGLVDDAVPPRPCGRRCRLGGRAGRPARPGAAGAR